MTTTTFSTEAAIRRFNRNKADIETGIRNARGRIENFKQILDTNPTVALSQWTFSASKAAVELEVYEDILAKINSGFKAARIQKVIVSRVRPWATQRPAVKTMMTDARREVAKRILDAASDNPSPDYDRAFMALKDLAALQTEGEEYLKNLPR